MKKTLILAIIALSGSIVAQQKHNQLYESLERQKLNNQSAFEFYLHSKSKNQTLSKDSKRITETLVHRLNEKRDKLSFMFQGKPYFLTINDKDQILNSNADAIQKGNIINGLSKAYNGKGIEVSVFDGGRVYGEHIDFGTSGHNRISNKEKSTVDYSSHATSVTDIIGGIGHDISNGKVSGNTKGFMPKATFKSYSFRTTTLEGEQKDKSVFQKILGSKAPLSNHSYGINAQWEYDDENTAGWYWNGYYDAKNKVSYDLAGSYLNNDKNYDDIVYDNPNMIIVKSAGNSYGDGPAGYKLDSYYEDENGDYKKFISEDVLPSDNCSQGYDCIGAGSLAKNIIVVGATQKLKNSDNRYQKSTDVEKASYSSAGPRDDGAIKPDIAGVGSDIFYASTTSTGSSDWGMGDGTSFSAPQVTGIIGLWSQIYKDLFQGSELNAASAKALLIHSAQDAGNVGPDVWYGWGFADAKKGAELLVDAANKKVIFENKTLKNRERQSFDIYTDGSQPLKVTMVWTDPSYKNIPTTYQDAHNNRTSKLINDLDIRLVNVETKHVYQPWKLDANHPMNPATQGDNLVDNVEQIEVNSLPKGNYKVEVSHKENLLNNVGNTSSQDYSIIISGTSKNMSVAESNKSLITIYPTLVKDNFRVQNNKDVTGLFIYDVSGKLLSTIKEGLNQPIPMQGYSPGVYIVQITTSAGIVITQKIIKN
ncbi:S8 family peptidase [Riemerella columbina]|uniref:S8 family peptidase n=1 Tax=Riemerella columbina TaxID=103810 RepID=UPI000380AC58|nr:S8 family peptidase [Riemerella columbina]